MKSMNVKKVMMIGTCCVVLDAATLHCMNNVAAVVDIQENADKQARGKVLKSSSDTIEMLNQFLKYKSIVVLRMRFAYRDALRAMKAMEAGASCDKKFINENITLILGHVKEFFGEIRSYAQAVKPLVEESLLDNTRSAPGCLILKFIESKDAVDVFFNKNINSKDDFTKFCTELMTFLADLRVSFSKEVIDEETKLIERTKKREAEAKGTKSA